MNHIIRFVVFSYYISFHYLCIKRCDVNTYVQISLSLPYFRVYYILTNLYRIHYRWIKRFDLNKCVQISLSFPYFRVYHTLINLYRTLCRPPPDVWVTNYGLELSSCNIFCVEYCRDNPCAKQSLFSSSVRLANASLLSGRRSFTDHPLS